MRLDYVDKTGAFVLHVPRKEAKLIQSLMVEHGLDFSVPASSGETAVLFTSDPYAAVTFVKHATPKAKEQLASLHLAIEASWRHESTAHIKCPAGEDLWPFQRAGVEYAMSKPHALIGDQPGLGKTSQAICVANEMGAKRVLVICPAAIRVQWVLNIRRWTTMPWGQCVIHNILQAKHGVHPNANWTVCSYELAAHPGIGTALAKGTYDLMILDEAHYLKTADSKRTRAIFGGGRERAFPALCERAGKILALTGTPLPNRPREAYSLARALCFDAIDWASEDDFKERYNPSKVVERTLANGRTVRFKDEKTGRSFELQNRLRSHFMVRREKHGPRGVMKQLHMPIYDIVQLEKTGAVKQALEAESMLHIDPENLTGADAKVLGHVSEVRRMMGIALAPQIVDYVKMLIDGGTEKLVVFAWHTEVLNILENGLSRLGVVRIDGSTSATARPARIKQFQTDPSIHLCIGNMLAMGVGTDGLQAVASHALIAEPDWVPGNNIQAVDRLDRGGQGRQVQADIFVAPGSFAERVLASALRKLNTINKTLDAQV